MTRRSQASSRRRHLYEHRSQPLLPRPLFLRRLLLHTGAALLVAAVSLAIGVLGYRLIENLAWIDALLNASMILGGMGQIDRLQTEAGKIFASAYALFSGGVFLVVAGILVAPVAHRILHRLHLEEPEDS
ncbi:MAG: hypothetical protein A2Z17_01070 [Gammaproteobacteria bacterium RBG_16_66_13]|nr:MAG: hypothetical protein A2Z17_01070 [Gammaproteobacteria bacterium RBG_16_66_13]